MHVSVRTLATALIALLLVCPAVTFAQAGQGVVRGEVIDGSGAVLPGVTVVATAPDGQVLATVVTDTAGSYVFAALPAAPVTLSFQLEGFDTAIVKLVVRTTAESRVVQRLGLAHVTESVDVVAKAPEDPPPPPPPPPVVVPVPAHDHDSVCGPAKPGLTRESFGTIEARRYEAKRGLYSKGDELLIDGGTLTGLEVGRNFVVRHYFQVMGATGAAATGEHTSGLLQIVAADELTATAIVVYACDEMKKGDFLAAFKPEPVRSAEPFGIPAYGSGDAARILFADAGSMLGVARRMMVIDRGHDHGIRVGQRLTLFRREGRGSRTPDVVGDAVVVAVRNDSATIRVERAIDAIMSGDWAAPQHQATVAPSAATTVTHLTR